jgi:DNA repair protein RadD
MEPRVIELRPYQQSAIDEARDAFRTQRAVLFQLPTGGGKTVTASTVVHGAAQKRNRVWWLTHRRELASQASRTFYDLGIPHGLIQAGTVTDANALVQVASIQTIARRLDKLPEPALIVFDEAHHIGAAQWDQVFNYHRRAKILGLSATPCRLDGQGLGRWFGHMVEGPTVRELIDNGSLCDFRLFAPSVPDLSGVGSLAGDFKSGALAKAMDRPAIVGDAIGHYRQLCPGKRAVVFAAGVANSQSIVAQFNAAGIPAEHVDGSMPAVERDAIVDRFRRGETLILSNADLFGEGFDVPAIEAVILLRPTKSLSLYLQQVGRALRPMPGKDVAIILDHAGNSLRHGLPDDEREWSLDDREKRAKREELETPVKQCEECFFVYRPAPKCPCCGYAPPVQSREIEQIEGTLAEVKRPEPRAKFREQGRAGSLDDLIQLGRERGYKSPEFWARKVWASRQGRAAA